MSNKKVTKLKRKNAPQPEEVRAKNIIVTKINILNNWIKEGIPSKKDEGNNYSRDINGEVIIDYYPSSIQQFLKWNGTQNCIQVKKQMEDKYGEIRGTGRATLERYDNLYEQVQQLIVLLKKSEKKQKAVENKTSKIEQLNADVDMQIKARELSEIQHRQSTQIINSLREKLNDEIKSHNSTKKLWASEVRSKDEEITSLNIENRKLTSYLAKVTPIKKVDK